MHGQQNVKRVELVLLVWKKYRITARSIFRSKACEAGKNWEIKWKKRAIICINSYNEIQRKKCKIVSLFLYNAVKNSAKVELKLHAFLTTTIDEVTL